MGTLVPVLGTILQVGSVLGGVANFAQPFIQDRVDSKHLKEQNALQQKLNAQAASLKQEQNRVETQAADSQRRAALKRAMARQRANFGAQGVGSGAGSSEAVLLGLFDQSDEEREAAEKLSALREQAINQNLGAQSQLNLLQQTQLRENQYVKYISRLT